MTENIATQKEINQTRARTLWLTISTLIKTAKVNQEAIRELLEEVNLWMEDFGELDSEVLDFQSTAQMVLEALSWPEE